MLGSFRFLYLEVEKGKGGIEHNLQDGIDGDQDGAVLGAAARELVPNQDHRDAPREADQYHAVAVVRQIRQCRPRKSHLHIQCCCISMPIINCPSSI